MVEQIFLSPQVKRNVIISNKLVYSSWFNSNDLRLKTKTAGGGLCAHTRKKKKDQGN